MLFVSFRFNFFERQPSNLNKISDPSFTLLSYQDDESKQCLSFSLVILRRTLQRVRIQTHNLQARYLNVLPLTLLFEELSQTDSRIKCTSSELHKSLNTLSYLDIRCLNLNFSLCTGRLRLSVCVSIRSLPDPNVQQQLVVSGHHPAALGSGSALLQPHLGMRGINV